MKRFETLVIAIPDPTPEEQTEGQARRDREALVHALFHHPWLVHMAEGDWRRGPLVSALPADGSQAAPVTPPAASEGQEPAPVTPTQAAILMAAVGTLFRDDHAGLGPDHRADPVLRRIREATVSPGFGRPPADSTTLAALRRIREAIAQGVGGSPPDDASATPPPAPDAIDHPAHYTSHPSGIEPIQITRHESFTRGNAIKYLMRAGRKDPDPRTDLRKARRYIDFELEDLERLVDRPETRGAPGA